MVENSKQLTIQSNIRSLLRDLGFLLDDRLRDLRKDTRYAHVRNSDVKVFVRASRYPSTLAEIARSLRVSRQAVHLSVKRLQALGVVELVAQPNNRRDKQVQITERGKQAESIAAAQIATIESEMAAVIGSDGVTLFRTLLTKLIKDLTPPA